MGSQSQHGATPQPQSFDPLVGSNETKLTTPRSDESHDQKNYDEKYLDMNHFFKSGTHNEAGQMQSGWIQKALFLRSGGAKAKAICDEWDNEHYLKHYDRRRCRLCYDEHSGGFFSRAEQCDAANHRRFRHARLYMYVTR